MCGLLLTAPSTQSSGNCRVALPARRHGCGCGSAQDSPQVGRVSVLLLREGVAEGGLERESGRCGGAVGSLGRASPSPQSFLGTPWV